VSTVPTFRDFEEFWPYYLGEHANLTNRVLHFVGTSCVILLTVAAVVSMQPRVFFALPVFGYGFAWVGHFLVEKNRPATFKHPLWSLRGDFRMYGRMLRGQLWTAAPARQT
jgi:hypothetical protein